MTGITTSGTRVHLILNAQGKPHLRENAQLRVLNMAACQTALNTGASTTCNWRGSSQRPAAVSVTCGQGPSTQTTPRGLPAAAPPGCDARRNSRRPAARSPGAPGRRPAALPRVACWRGPPEEVRSPGLLAPGRARAQGPLDGMDWKGPPQQECRSAHRQHHRPL